MRDAITLLDFGILFNMAGILGALLLSLTVAFVYRRAFFLWWTASYVVLAVALPLLGEARLLPLGAAAYIGYTWLVGMTAAHLGGHPFGRRARLAAGGTIAAAVLWLLAGGAPEPAWLLMIACVSVAHGYLGFTLLRSAGRTGATGMWLGALVLFTGLWVWTAPFLVKTPHMWIGYVVAGGLHFFLGLGMTVYLIELSVGELRSRHEALSRFDERKTALIATFNHELRTPLTVIRGSADLLEDGLAGDMGAEQRELVAHIVRQGRVLDGLIQDMLDFSSLRFGRLPTVMERADLAAVVREVVEGFSVLYAEQGVALTFEPGPETLPGIFDPGQMARVTSNLLGNALKFTPAGGGVSVRLAREGDGAVLSVQDTGVGLAGQDLDQLFTPFFQGRSSGSGAGLGLAICQSIVEEGHRGRIWAERPASGGAAFYVAIPLSREAEPAA